uniref:ephrin type-A receptor 5-like isoform X1 n=1 Tax=Styela clava TaxID=7725 RepID=UPI00193A2B5B|nr:ephrin type-A receptor 5-like isoform X1 [Styela clava]
MHLLPYQHWLLCLLIFITFMDVGQSDIRVLFDTKQSKSDLKWEKHPSNGWEELSGLDENAAPIRFHQVCRNDIPNQNNWIRSPYITANGAQRVYMDITYSMMKCDTCKETFTLYYYQSNSDVASSTFPRWQAQPYIKIDTVAAGTRFDASSSSNGGINHKTFSIGLRRKGLYVAAQDEGTCMSLIATKLYHYYCPETTHGLAYFSETLPGSEVSSLVAVDGKCVTNAVYTNGEIPKYRCNSNGEWKVPTGLCQCRGGYYPDPDLTACNACKPGYYKAGNGNHACQKCPPHSTSHSTGATMCQCQLGYYRAGKDSIDQPCTRPPSSPMNITWEMENRRAKISWVTPSSTGARSDLYYSAACSECDAEFQRCRTCPSSIRFAPSDRHHLTQTFISLQGLEMFKHYKIKISSHNGVSSVSKEQANYETVEFSTNDNVPTKPQNFMATSKTSNSITLKWDLPSKLSDKVTGYEIHALPLPDTASPNAPNSPNIAPILVKARGTNFTLTDLYAGTAYEIRVRALSPDGTGPYSDTLVFATKDDVIPSAKPHEEAGGMGLIIGIVAGVIIVLVVVIIAVIMMRRRRANDIIRQENDRARAKMAGTSDERQGLTDGFNDSLVVRLPPLASSNNGRTTYTDYRDPQKGVKEIAREIEFTDIKIEKVIGQGEFGEVCKGKLTEGKKSSVVAVKRLKRGATLIDQTNLLREACTMAQFRDPNILQLKGVVTKTVPTMIISEFMENGSLDRFLMANRGQFSVLQLVNMLHGISSGMRYLSDMQYVHRDLAARNILVGDDYVCKVSDFGLSRNLENDPHATYTTQGGKIPIRWTAPECFRYRRFTSASDVWSYGIVMWEVMSYGEKPYWDMTNEHVTESIEDGFRLPAPQDCPQVLHRLMLDCWSNDAAARPTFREIFIRMKRFVQQPDMLVDREPITDPGSAFLDPESPTDLSKRTLTVDEWLELMKLGAYRQSFLDNGINNLSEIIQLTAQDFERLGINENVHRTRLQSGIQTLRRHISGDSANNSATLPMHSNTTPKEVTSATTPRGGAVGVGPVSYNKENVLIV